MSENETPEVLAPSKLSKIRKIASASAGAAAIGVPCATFVAVSIIGLKISKNEVEVARLTLEAAKLADKAS